MFVMTKIIIGSILFTLFSFYPYAG